MYFQKFYEFQRDNLVHEYKNDMCTCLIATTPERIKRHVTEYGWKIFSLNHSKPKSAFVIQKSGRAPELWVNRTYTGYRRAFIEYLKMFYNFKGVRIPQKWQVDHLQSRHRFKKDHPPYFIRLYLIDRSINASYGAGFEKMFYSNERESFPSGGIHMDWLTFLKVYGKKLPSKSIGQSLWAEWAWKLAEQLENEGIEDKVLAYFGISVVLNLGYTGIYSSLPLQDSFKKAALNHPTIHCFPELKCS